MRPLFFAIKRVHLCALKRLAPVAASVELTPARFDLLQVVAFHDEWGIAQRTLVQLLGVSGAVVSRMLHSLTELGLVWRYRWEKDRRVKIVQLTEEGLNRYADVAFTYLCEGRVAAIEEEIFTKLDPPSRPEYEKLGKFARIATWLGRMRRRLGDRAPFLHPWRLADLVDDDLRAVRVNERDIDMSMPREAEIMRGLRVPPSLANLTDEEHDARVGAELDAEIAANMHCDAAFEPEAFTRQVREEEARKRQALQEMLLERRAVVQQALAIERQALERHAIEQEALDQQVLRPAALEEDAAEQQAIAVGDDDLEQQALVQQTFEQRRLVQNQLARHMLEPKALGADIAGVDALERPSLERPSLERPSLERPSLERPSLERPSLEPHALEQKAFEEQAFDLQVLRPTKVETGTLERQSIGERPVTFGQAASPPPELARSWAGPSEEETTEGGAAGDNPDDPPQGALHDLDELRCFDAFDHPEDFDLDTANDFDFDDDLDDFDDDDDAPPVTGVSQVVENDEAICIVGREEAGTAHVPNRPAHIVDATRPLDGVRAAPATEGGADHDVPRSPSAAELRPSGEAPREQPASHILPYEDVESRTGDEERPSAPAPGGVDSS